MEPTNEDRVKRFEDALERYETYEDEARTAAIDMLSDMMHWAKARGHSFFKMHTMAACHFKEESDVGS
jgi:transposase